MRAKNNIKNVRQPKKPTVPVSPVKRYVQSFWHRIRLLMPSPTSLVRGFSENYTFLYRTTGAFVVGAPPVIITNYYQVSQFAEQFKVEWPAIATVLDRHVLIGCLLAGVWVSVMMGIHRFFASFSVSGPPGWEVAPATILRVLDNIVGVKQQRFRNYLSDIGKQSPPPSHADIFNTITQP
ncbi:MAG: hypothetical protein Q8J72_07940, partial [Rhodocyclaceae bacterium]|nr:hypothetical protein [Rhodocyclaceae bacterium]